MSNHSSSQFLYLITREWKSHRLHKIEIWFVEHNKKYYVISEHQEKSHWVKNILYDSKISFEVNEKLFRGHARTIEDATEKDLISEISKLMNNKYGWSNGLIVELSPIWVCFAKH